MLAAAVGFWETITGGLTGRGEIRLILQPAMAIVLGVRFGIADAREGRKPFLLRMLTERGRWNLFKESLHEAAIPLAVAIAVDAILQYVALQYVRPVAAVVVGIFLVWLPFGVSRALANRIWTRRHRAAEHV